MSIATNSDLLRYGTVIFDSECECEKGCRRLRIFAFEGGLYLLDMFNGEVVRTESVSLKEVL